MVIGGIVVGGVGMNVVVVVDIVVVVVAVVMIIEMVLFDCASLERDEHISGLMYIKVDRNPRGSLLATAAARVACCGAS